MDANNLMSRQRWLQKHFDTRYNWFNPTYQALGMNNGVDFDGNIWTLKPRWLQQLFR